MRGKIRVGVFLLLISLLWRGLVSAEPAPQTIVMHAAEAGGTATGNVLNVLGYGTVGIQTVIASAWDGTLTFQVSNDGSNYVGVLCRLSTTATLSLTTAAANVAVACPVGGFKYFKAPISSRTTGSVTVTANLIAAPLLAQAPASASGLGSFTSAELASALTNETGTGLAVFATSPTFTTPLLGTPTSGTLTNTTGFPTANLAGLGSGMATFLATPTSANLAATLTNETGTGVAVFNNTPSLVTATVDFPGDGSTNHINALVITRTDPGQTPTLRATDILFKDSLNITTTAAISAVRAAAANNWYGDLVLYAHPTNGQGTTITDLTEFLRLDGVNNRVLITPAVTITDLATTGAATGKTVVCADTAGKLYRSTSGVACAN